MFWVISVYFNIRNTLPNLAHSSWDALYMYSTNIPPIMIINRIYETQNLLSLYLVSFLVGLRTYQHPLYRSISSLLCSFLHSPVTSSLLDTNIFLRTLFSNTLSLISSLNVGDQVSHPYNTTCAFVGMYSKRSNFSS